MRDDTGSSVFNTSEDGNRYVLMMIDQFTKWVEMAAIPEQSALTIAEKFVVHFEATFGCPLEVHTDQGRNFDGNLFKSLRTILEVAKTRTTPYHPSSIGQIERFNTVLLQMIRCYIEKKSRRWDKNIPLLSMALHSMFNRQTGHTPNKLMLGRETIQPVQLLLGIPQQCQEQLDPDSWVVKLADSLREVH
jgi:transposase InsO family protein